MQQSAAAVIQACNEELAAKGYPCRWNDQAVLNEGNKGCLVYLSQGLHADQV